MIPGSANPLLLKSAAAAGGLQIERSLRFNSSDSAYLSKVFAVAGNQKTWTWSGWIKRGKLGSEYRFFDARDGGLQQYFRFDSSNALRVLDSNGTLITSQVFRDLSAWYHVLVALDTTQSTASNRIKLYVNGSQVTTFSTESYPTQNSDILFNSACTHMIGWSAGTTEWFDGYLTNIHFIDGQQLTPSSFTETDATTGQLIPKTYSGSYGTNGFNLLFADNSSNTASTLGKDTSGLSNNWTPNNLSVTAGVGNDSLVDSPTNYGTDTGVGGEVRGNYATLNPVATPTGTSTFSNGNLEMVGSSWGRGLATFLIPENTGKYYWETISISGNEFIVGMETFDNGQSSGTPSLRRSGGFSYTWNGTYYIASTQVASGKPNYSTAGTIVQYAFDSTTKKLWFGVNGTWNDGNPATGINESLALSGTAWYPTINIDTGHKLGINFGQRAFAYTAPSGFKALCTQNLPAPLVAKSNTVFDVVLYTGNGGTQSITGLSFSPDWVWIKRRDTSSSHMIFDIVRGLPNRLASNETSGDNTDANNLVSFDAAGFTTSTGAAVNGGSLVAWCWDAGTSTVSNTAGSITSQVRANATAGFSVITWTGNATLNATIGHGLGVAPLIVIIKNRSTTTDWLVYTSLIDGTADFLKLNTTAAKANLTSNVATSSLYSLDNGSDMNGSGNSMVAYAFAPVVGYSSFGSYTGNGDADGPFIYTGFRPKFFMHKDYTAGGAGRNWLIWDAARETYNAEQTILFANDSGAESSNSAHAIDFVSNGIKIRNANANINPNGVGFIYMAFAESPFNYSRAR
jgi:hypothetical protein